MPLIPQKRKRQVHEKMKIRNRKITVRLSEKERKFLGEQADAGGMKIEPYIRELIMGNEVKSRPKEEWAEVVRQVAAVGNNINQIARSVNAGIAAPKDAREAVELLGRVYERLYDMGRH